MTKDEMKNRISLALKDPTLQQGFEIICKENAELARNLEQTEKDLADYQFNYPTIKELQKENAELNKQIEKMKCCENCRWEEPSSFCDGCKRLKGQIFSDVITNDNWELRRYENA